MFGDEAVRSLNEHGATLYTYTLIGGSQPFLPEIEEQIRALKRELIPASDPSTWKIHMTKIWSGQQRRKIPEFSNWTKKETDRLIDGVAEILQSAQNKLFKYNIMLAGQPPRGMTKSDFEKYVKKEAYALLVMRAIEAITALGGQPVITFDAQKPVKGNAAIHHWARERFQNGQGTLLYSFLSHSIFIPEPVFVEPASRPLLEIADLISFSVARHHFCISRRRDPDIDLSAWGEINYQTFSSGSNDLIYKNSVGYPWSINYPRVRR